MKKGKKCDFTELKSLGIKYSSASGILSDFKWLIFQQLIGFFHAIFYFPVWQARKADKLAGWLDCREARLFSPQGLT